jgi:hypothetical protein
MAYWKFKVYQAEDGESQFQAWYERQETGVKGYFDGQLYHVSTNENAPETEFMRLPGYEGLFELVINIELDYGVIAAIPIGIWQPDSPNFIILQCSERVGDDYDPPIYKALEYKQAWENHRGVINDYIPDEFGD